MIAMWDQLFSGLSAGASDGLERGDGWQAFAAMHEVLNRSWQEAYACLVPGGILAVNIGDAVRTVGETFSLYPNHARVMMALREIGFATLPLILWKKPTNSPTKFMGSGMLPGGAYVTLEHEYIILARKGVPRRPGSPNERMRRRRAAIFWEERNRWFSDQWDVRGDAQNATGIGRDRSAAFPLEIPFRLVAMYSWEGDTVLDPFSGTGTTALAAAALGRDSVSIEVSEEANSAARDRLLQPESAAAAADRQRERLDRHQAFAQTRESAHFNGGLGSAVVTSQETDLVLRGLEGIGRTGKNDVLEATYGADLHPLNSD